MSPHKVQGSDVVSSSANSHPGGSRAVFLPGFPTCRHCWTQPTGMCMESLLSALHALVSVLGKKLRSLELPLLWEIQEKSSKSKDWRAGGIDRQTRCHLHRKAGLEIWKARTQKTGLQEGRLLRCIQIVGFWWGKRCQASRDGGTAQQEGSKGSGVRKESTCCCLHG